LVLPNHRSIVEEFGIHKFGPKTDSQRSLAMDSTLYDVLNQITLDAQIAPYANSERDLLEVHLDKVQTGDLLLLDKGYPCFWLLFLLKARGIEFCVRVKDDWWLKVKNFTQSDELEHIITFSLQKKPEKVGCLSSYAGCNYYLPVDKNSTGKWGERDFMHVIDRH
jgi:hypothetical protein